MPEKIQEVILAGDPSLGGRLLTERARVALTQEQFASWGAVRRVDQHLYEQNVKLPSFNYFKNLLSHKVNVAHILLGDRVPPAGFEPLTLSSTLISVMDAVAGDLSVDLAGDKLPVRDRLEFFHLLCEAVSSVNEPETK